MSANLQVVKAGPEIPNFATGDPSLNDQTIHTVIHFVNEQRYRRPALAAGPVEHSAVAEEYGISFEFAGIQFYFPTGQPVEIESIRGKLTWDFFHGDQGGFVQIPASAGAIFNRLMTEFSDRGVTLIGKGPLSSIPPSVVKSAVEQARRGADKYMRDAIREEVGMFRKGQVTSFSEKIIRFAGEIGEPLPQPGDQINREREDRQEATTASIAETLQSLARAQAETVKVQKTMIEQAAATNAALLALLKKQEKQ